MFKLLALALLSYSTVATATDFTRTTLPPAPQPRTQKQNLITTQPDPAQSSHQIFLSPQAATLTLTPILTHRDSHYNIVVVGFHCSSHGELYEL
jgi:hypothetical protein